MEFFRDITLMAQNKKGHMGSTTIVNLPSDKVNPTQYECLVSMYQKMHKNQVLKENIGSFIFVSRDFINELNSFESR